MKLIEQLWFGQPWWQWLCWPFLYPLSRLFAFLSSRRRHQYDIGKKPVYRASVPVIVVGNITAGGNGKTPVVVWLVEQLQAKGFRVGVVSRGYGGKAPYYPYEVSSTTSTDISGDEPVLIAKRTQALVVVSPIRSEAVAMLENKVDIIITDDGLQHYALARDLEIVVIDGQRRFGNQKLLPLGPLRESCQRLLDVDFKICNGGMALEDEIPMMLKPSQWINVKTGQIQSSEAFESVVAMAGIGYPERFFQTVRALDLSPLECHGFPDHQAYSYESLHALTTHSQSLLMTEKDAVKCSAFAQDNWWYLPVNADIPTDSANQLIQRIIEVKEHYGSSLT